MDALAALLGVIFGYSALSKTLPSGRHRFQTTLSDIGLSAPLSRVLAVVIPVAELLVAVGLVLPPYRQVAAGAGIALLASFSVVAIWTVKSDRQIACSCFGNLSQDERLGWNTVLRNAILGVFIAIVLLDSLFDFFPDSGIVVDALILSLVANLAAGILILMVLRTHGRLLIDLGVDSYRLKGGDGLAVGEPAPDISIFVKDAVGEPTPTTVAEVIKTSQTQAIAMFVDEHCAACHSLFPLLRSWSEQLRDRATVIVIASGNELNEELVDAGKEGIVQIVYDAEGLLGNAFQIKGTPSAIRISADGKISSRPALGKDSIFSLLQNVI